MRLDEIRKKIDRIDDTILDLLIERLNLSVEAAEAKAQLKRPVRDPEREKRIFKRLAATAKQAGVDESFVFDIFTRILDQSNRIQEHLLTKK